MTTTSRCRYLFFAHLILLLISTSSIIGTSAYWLLISADLMNTEIESLAGEQSRFTSGISLHNTVFNSHAGNQGATMAAIHQHYSIYGKIIRDSLPKLKTKDPRGFRNEHVLVALRSAWKNRIILQQIIPFSPKPNKVLNNKETTTFNMPTTTEEVVISNEPELNETTIITGAAITSSSILLTEPITEPTTTTSVLEETTTSPTTTTTAIIPQDESSTTTECAATTTEEISTTLPPTEETDAVTSETTPETTITISTTEIITETTSTTVEPIDLTSPTSPPVENIVVMPVAADTPDETTTATTTIVTEADITETPPTTEEPPTTEPASTTPETTTTATVQETTTTTPPIYVGVPVILEPEQYRVTMPPLMSLFRRPLRPKWPVHLRRLILPGRHSQRFQQLSGDDRTTRKTRTTRPQEPNTANTNDPSPPTSTETTSRIRRRRHIIDDSTNQNRNQCPEDIQQMSCLLMSQYNRGTIFFLPWTWKSLVVKIQETNGNETEPLNDDIKTELPISPLEIIASICLGYKLPQEVQCPELATLAKLSRMSTSFYDKHNEPLYVASLSGERLCRVDARRRNKAGTSIANLPTLTLTNDTVISITSEATSGRGVVLLCGAIIYPSISGSGAGASKPVRANESCNELGREAQTDFTNEVGQFNRTINAVLATTYKCRSYSNAISGFHFV